MPDMPAGAEQGVVKGLYRYKSVDARQTKAAVRPQLFGSGPIAREAEKAADILAEQFGVSTDVWSATSYNRLRRDAEAAQRWNLLHPNEKPRVSYLESVLSGVKGPFIAVSDSMKIVQDQIRQWVPGRYVTLGTDGFGRSDTRQVLRRHFEINANHIAYATLAALADEGQFDRGELPKVLKALDIDPEKVDPATA
jgi:pyruvate dehydrogenase E1 component